jgi:putative transposase
MLRPTDLYTPSTRKYEGLPDVSYPFHDKTLTITQCGRICIAGQKIHLSTVFAGHDVGAASGRRGVARELYGLRFRVL